MTPLPAELLAKIDALELEARQVVEGHLAGRHKSPQFGFAVEFAQHREYSPGDDIKHIDWKVYGRTERYHLKQYEQETNLVAWMLVDASESMKVRSGEKSKYEVACRAAAALGFLTLQQTDSVGLVTFDRTVRHFLRPSARAGNHFREMLKLLLDGPSGQPANVGASLDEIASRLGRRGIVFLFSDLLDDVAPLVEGIRHLKYQKHEVIVIHVLDAAELDFPFRHPTLFKGLEAWPELNTDPLSVREEYLKELNKHLTELESACRTLESDYVRLRTDADLGQELATYLRKRLER
jgi:uncharacterized protein (DUF58 family)